MQEWFINLFMNIIGWDVIISIVMTAVIGFLGVKWKISKKLLKEVKELMEVLSDALADDTIDKEEAAKILKETQDVIATVKELLKKQ